MKTEKENLKKYFRRQIEKSNSSIEAYKKILKEKKAFGIELDEELEKAALNGLMLAKEDKKKSIEILKEIERRYA